MVSPSPSKDKSAKSTPAKDKPATQRKPGPPRPMTKRRMENIAKFHIERFATTATHLKRVLLRRAERARHAHGGDTSEFTAWAEEIVAHMVRCGMVDDARYALGRAIALRSLGKSPGKIRAALSAKGVGRDLIATALDSTAITATGDDATLNAALAYARRRRLGPFGIQTGDAAAKRKQLSKDLAALARAGFSYDIAKQVMSATPEGSR